MFSRVITGAESGGSDAGRASAKAMLAVSAPAIRWINSPVAQPQSMEMMI